MASEVAKQEFSQWLIGYRQHTSQTQAQLADVLGVHRTTVNRWEKIRLYPDWRVRVRLNELAEIRNYRPVPIKKF